ncbi:MAG TPA: cobalt transporter [Stellaceae bacterium]|nr:cobalt transporter [Stellaceae bacterium]
MGPTAECRTQLVREAFRLEWLTIGWMIVEAVVALASGVVARSISLIAFGLDSLIELASAWVLIWRLDIELRRGRRLVEKAERTASRIGGALQFCARGLHRGGPGGWRLWNHQGAEFSWPGLLVAVAAIPIKWLLSRRKLAIAEALGSRALHADPVESITCGWLSFVVLIGLLAQFALGAWWVDAVTLPVIVRLLIKEGREAREGDDQKGGRHEEF